MAFKQEDLVMVVNSAKEFMEAVLPGKLTPDKIAGLDVTVALEVVGEGGGQWVVTLRGGRAEVCAGVISNPTISIKIKDSDFVKVVNQEISARRVYLGGKVQFQGDPEAALKLQKLGIV
jgi:hypothetical protein